jgi:hypothetical protein
MLQHKYLLLSNPDLQQIFILTGTKPFKCTHCNYSCVNKSMLNSHMKSHTNVYQYRCADCT